MKDAHTIVPDCDILIEGGRISCVGEDASFNSRSCEVIDGEGLIAIPGLVNSHTHLCQTMIRGMRDDLNFTSWCDEVMLPLYGAIRECQRNKTVDEIAYLWSAMASIEALKGGVTCVFDDDFIEEPVLQAWVDAGIRGVGAPGIVDQGLADEFTRDVDEKKDRILSLIENWAGRDPLVTLGLVASTPYLCSKNLLLWLKDTARDYGLPIQTHLSETWLEAKDMLREFGEPPTMYFDRLGILGSEFSAVHCVYLLPEEIELLSRMKCSIVYCPKSNMKLGNGAAPVKKFIDADITVALGTDGPASNDLIDMFEEMRFGALLQKGFTKDPKTVSASDILAMATSAGGKVCGLDTGRIEAGAPADIALIDSSRSNLIPFNKPAEMLVHCVKACDVKTVIVNGRVVVRDHRILTLDEEEIRRRARRAFSEVLQSL